MRRIRPQPTASPSPADWLPRLLHALTSSGVAPLTIRTYRQDLTLFFTWLQEQKGQLPPLEELTPFDLQAYRHHLVRIRRLRPATVNHRIQAIRWLCRWAHREGIIGTDPSTGLASLRVPRRRRPAGLATNQVHALLSAAGSSRKSQSARNYALVQLMLQTGIRVGEVSSLLIADVTIHDRSGQVRVRLGKGEKERDVPLNATARRALRAYFETRPHLNQDDPLFLSHRNEPLTPRSIQALFQTLARRAGITDPPLTPHTLRHTFSLVYYSRSASRAATISKPDRARARARARARNDPALGSGRSSGCPTSATIPASSSSSPTSSATTPSTPPPSIPSPPARISQRTSSEATSTSTGDARLSGTCSLLAEDHLGLFCSRLKSASD